MKCAQHNLEFTVESTPEAALQAREALAELRGTVADETYADLRVVVSELVANSVEHGPAGPVSVSIELLAAGGVSGWVRDGGPGGVKISEGAEPGVGLGLLIVDTLAASWGTRPASSDVWFELAAPQVWVPSAVRSLQENGLRGEPAARSGGSRLRVRSSEDCR
jgi:anti-sigma regulatory factor (Ser/Thr protein kinase)